MMKRSIEAILLAGLLLVGLVNSALAGPLPERTADEEVIESGEADLLGRGTPQQVQLVGRKADFGTFYRDVYLNIFDGETLVASQPLDKMSGYYGVRKALFFGDFTGDQVPEVFVSLATGGSGGLINYRLVTWRDEQGVLLFGAAQNRGLSCTLTSADDWRLQVRTEQGGATLQLDGVVRRAEYRRLGYFDEQGKVLKPLPAFVAPFGWLEPEDRDGDGHYMLRGWQQLSGAYRADQIGWLESVWRYEHDAWTILNVNLGQRLMP